MNIQDIRPTQGIWIIGLINESYFSIASSLWRPVSLLVTQRFDGLSLQMPLFKKSLGRKRELSLCFGEPLLKVKKRLLMKISILFLNQHTHLRSQRIDDFSEMVISKR